MHTFRNISILNSWKGRNLTKRPNQTVFSFCGQEFQNSAIQRQQHTGSAANGDHISFRKLSSLWGEIISNSNENSQEINAGRSEVSQLIKRRRQLRFN